MRHLALRIGIVGVACGLAANAAPAQTAILTYVSGTGFDSGNCAIEAPCGSFRYALLQTDNHGTIRVLSAGDFAPVFINKSVSIVADGVAATIRNTGPCVAQRTGSADTSVRAAICINAPDAIVNLRGLTLDLLTNPNDNAIEFFAARALHMQNCVLRKGVQGLHFAPTADANLYVSDCMIANNSDYGMTIAPSGKANVNATLDRLHVENNRRGININNGAATGVLRATIRDSIVAGNRAEGVFVQTTKGDIRTMIDRTNISNNGTYGLRVSGAGNRTYIGGSTFSGNNVGLFSGGNSTLASFGTNSVAGNNTNGSPSSIVALE